MRRSLPQAWLTTSAAIVGAGGLLAGCGEPLDVASTDLAVATSIEPNRIELGAEVTLMITVEVRNIFDQAVKVDLGGPPAEWDDDLSQSVGVAYGFRIRAADGGAGGPGAVSFGQPEWEFEAGEIISHTFTVEVTQEDWADIRPVLYEVHGSFGRNVGPPAPLSVTFPMALGDEPSDPDGKDGG